METNHDGSGGSGTIPEEEAGLGETVEIKIKTLDSQSYSIRVEKNVAVPVLKEQLASVVGVPADNQRLICRGKVLKDDQLLSAYNVEDGHTLHLVARQPPATPGVGSSTVNAEGGQSDAGLHAPGSRSGHVSHSLLMGTINFPDNGEGQMPDLNRIINAVISSIGMHGAIPLQGGPGNSNNVTMGVLPTPSGVDTGVAEGRNDHDTGVRELELQIDALYGVPSTGTEGTGPNPIRVVQAPVVVPDALTTMSQYLDRLEQSFVAQDAVRLPSAHDNIVAEARVGSEAHPTGEEVRRGASPAALGALINRVNNLLRGQAGTALTGLASQLENEPAILDAAVRDDIQSTAHHDGNVMQQIGALLLELGRATLSLRMGQTPTESVVNSGPAIFISPTGPNPMMVQGTNVASFRQVFDLSGIQRQNALQGAGGVAVGTALPPTPGTLGPSPGVPGAPPRSIHIHIHTSDPGALSPSPSPSPSLSTVPRQFSSEEVVRIPAGATGLVRQLLERTDPRTASHSGAAPNEVGGSVRTNAETSEGPTANPNSMTSGSTGMQGALMTFHENGAVRVHPVRSRAVGHTHPSNPFDIPLARFQHQFIVRPASNPPSDTAVPAIVHPVSTAPSVMPRQMDAAGRSLPGEGVGPFSGAGSGDVSNLMTSLAPILQHLAGPIQQSGPPVPSQQQPNLDLHQPPSTNMDVRQSEGDPRATEDAQANRELPNGVSVESAAEAGVTGMVTDVVSGDNDRACSSSQPTLQMGILEGSQRGGASGGTSGGTANAPVTAPVGLGLGGLQPLPTRGRRRRQSVQFSEEEQRQAGQGVLQNLVAQRDGANDSLNQNRNNMPMAGIGNLMRAVGGGSDRQQAGPNIIGQLMRSPVMENLVQQVMQGVGDVDGGNGGRRGPAGGGLDLSGMWQQMMPVVSQMLGGGGPPSVRPRSTAGTSARAPTDGAGRETGSQPSGAERWQDALTQEEVAGWSETIANDEEAQQSMPPQRPFSDAYSCGTHAAKRQKTEVETAAEKLEDGGSAQVVLRDLADAASAEVLGSNGATSNEELTQQLMRVDGLSEAYLVVLFNDLAARVAADADFGNGSRFPNATRIFHQPSQTPTEPDGE